MLRAPAIGVIVAPMNTFDYLIDILLIAVVVRQMRTRELTARSVLTPLALVAVAAAVYVRPFPITSSDLTLVGLLVAAGAALGTLSGLATDVWQRPDGSVVSRAGRLAALAWVAGMGARFAFAVYSTHSGAPSVLRFSIQHDITGAHVWQTALVLMALGEVLARVGVLQARRGRASRDGDVRPSAAAVSPAVCA